MSGWSESNNQESRQAIQAAIDLGCNFFDSAWAYGDGNSDALLGEALARNKESASMLLQNTAEKSEVAGVPKDNYQDVFPPTMCSGTPNGFAKSWVSIASICCNFMSGTRLDGRAGVPRHRRAAQKEGWIRSFG